VPYGLKYIIPNQNRAPCRLRTPAGPGPRLGLGAGPGVLQTAAGLRPCMPSRLRPHP